MAETEDCPAPTIDSLALFIASMQRVVWYGEQMKANGLDGVNRPIQRDSQEEYQLTQVAEPARRYRDDILWELQNAPGYLELEAFCHTQRRELTVDWMREQRGRLITAGMRPEEADSLGLLEFRDMLASLDAARMTPPTPAAILARIVELRKQWPKPLEWGKLYDIVGAVNELWRMMAEAGISSPAYPDGLGVSQDYFAPRGRGDERFLAERHRLFLKALHVAECAVEKHQTKPGQAIEAGGEPATEIETKEPQFILSKYGAGYFVKAFGQEGQFSNLVGFRYLIPLLKQPNQPIAMAILVSQGAELAEKQEKVVNALAADNRDGATHETYLNGDKVFDEVGRRVLLGRLSELESELSNDDPAEAAEAREEYERIDSYLKTSTNLNGESRELGGDVARLRTSIRNAIRRVRDTLKSNGLPDLADHLKCVKAQGAFYCYRPVGANVEWAFQK